MKMLTAALVFVLPLSAAPSALAQQQGRSLAERGDRGYTDATRLATLLYDLSRQENLQLTPQQWRTIANEANVLANRVHARARSARWNQSGRDAATNVRTHVRNLQRSALGGDANAARTSAREALTHSHQLVDWMNQPPA